MTTLGNMAIGGLIGAVLALIATVVDRKWPS